MDDESLRGEEDAQCVWMAGGNTNGMKAYVKNHVSQAIHLLINSRLIHYSRVSQYGSCIFVLHC